MRLSHLAITNLRNIAEFSLEPGAHLNFIFGANGSGKTSILEAIYLLGRGRSFRSAYSSRIVRYGQHSLTLFGRVTDSQRDNNLGIQIKDGGFRAKLNGQFLKKSSDLAAIIPLLLITPDGDKLIKGSPRQRRRFLDWGLFHVEHQFLEMWQRYNRILMHRNAALRQGKSVLAPWNLQLIEVAEQLDCLRREYATQLSAVVLLCFKELIGIENVEFKYQSGWSKEQSFSEALNSNLEGDIKAGFTQRGPHRADLVMQVDGRPAAEYLSGGQQKLAACALFLAQARLYSKRLNKPCILLVDDLPSELDQEHRQALLDILQSTHGQVFVTATDPLAINPSGYEDSKVFHVEQGCLVQ